MIEYNGIEFWGLRGWPEYYVSECGKVLSAKYNKRRILSPGFDGNGYLNVNLCKNGKQETKKIHRLMAMTFLPEFNNPELVVDHKDGNKTNNNLDNLRMVPLSDNDRNQQDVLGVCEWFDEKSGVPCYRAQWYDETGARQSKYFSLHEYGDEEAYRLATEYRQEMIDIYYNRSKPSDS
jgi:hypothetical protein